jgi:hypothetical protein
VGGRLCQLTALKLAPMGAYSRVICLTAYA